MTTNSVFSTIPPERPAPGSEAARRTDGDRVRHALGRQTLDLFAVMLDSATVVPGASSDAIRSLAGADQDAAAVAASELASSPPPPGLRGRGLDAASRAAEQLAQRPTQPPAAESAGPQVTEPRFAPKNAAARPTPVEPQASGTSNDGSSSASGRGSAAADPAGVDVAAAGRASARAVPAASPEATPQSTAPNAVPGVPPAGAATLRGVSAASAATATGAAAAGAPGVSPGGGQAPAGGVFSIERGTAPGAKPQAAAPSKPASAAQDAEPAAQVQRGLAHVLRQGGGSVALRLTPHALGEVRVSLSVRSGRVDGVIETEHSAARDLLSRSIESLRASLEQRGVTVDRLEVRLREAAEGEARPSIAGGAGGSENAECGGAGGERGGMHTGTGGAGAEDSGGGTRRGQDADPDDGASTDTIDGVPEHGRPREPAGGWIRLDTIA